jgi:hypothetical protein
MSFGPLDDCTARVRDGGQVMVLGEFETPKEARACELAYWEWRRAIQARFAEECRRRSQQALKKFVSRNGERNDVARRRFRSGRAGAGTVIDGFIYWRREFPSVARSAGLAPRPAARQSPNRSRRSASRRQRRTAAARGDPDSEPEPPPPDLAQLADASKRLWARVRRREARLRVA